MKRQSVAKSLIQKLILYTAMGLIALCAVPTVLLLSVCFGVWSFAERIAKTL